MAMGSNTIKIHCDVCDQPISFDVSREKLSQQPDGILRITLAHGDPLHAIIVYVDKNMRVRGVEHADSFQMDAPSKQETIVSPSEVSDNLSEQLGEPCFQALYSYSEVEEREKTAFVLDKTILRTVCESGIICLSKIRQNVAFLEKAMGTKIDLSQIEAVCKKYIQEGLIKQI